MLRIAGLLVCLSLLVTGASAQLANMTSLVGTVTDSSSAAMAGVRITAVNEATRDTYATTTNTEGFYAIQFVRIGTYAITATQPGFDVHRATGVTVGTNQVVRTNFVMSIGQVTESLTVSSESPVIATDDASVSSVLDHKVTADLPLNGRDPLMLVVTVPGVILGQKNPTLQIAGAEDFIGMGTREVQNSISLDGVNISLNIVNYSPFRPSAEAIQEVVVQAGTYPAQYGGYMGVQINLVTKSGTNQLHGNVWEFLQNNNMNARGFFENRSRPQAPLHQNQFGVEVGGPVFIPRLYHGRDKTFFMFDYEGQRTSQATVSLTTSLTPAMRQGNFSEVLPGTVVTDPLANKTPFPGNIVPAARLAPQAINALKYMPLPNAPGVVNNYVASVFYANTTDQGIGRIDQNVGERTRFFLRYAGADTGFLNGAVNPFDAKAQPLQNRNGAFDYTQIISNSMVNDMRFGFSKIKVDNIGLFATPALANAGTELGIPGFTSSMANPGLPNLTISGFIPLGGENGAATPTWETDHTWQGSDVFNWTHGAHSISAGLEIRLLMTDRTANNGIRGVFTFSGTIAGYAPADFMLGLPLTVLTPGPEYPGGAAVYRDGFFVMDKWNLSRKLTLSYGLRYELPTVPESTTGNATILNYPTSTHFIPTTVPSKIPLNDPYHKAFAPRIGVAYRITKDWVLRSGFGLYYNPEHLNIYTLASTNPPFSTIYTYNSNPASPTQLLTLSNPTPAGALGATPVPNAYAINPNLPPSYMNQWSLDVQRTLWKNAGLNVGYLGSHSVHLDHSFYVNTPLPGPGAIQPRRPNQLFGTIRVAQNDETSNYNGLIVTLRQRSAFGLTLLASYTWSHSLDVSSDINASDGQTANPLSWRSDYGNANWDIRHRFVASYVYDLPFFKSSKSTLLKYTIANWELSGVTTIQTGLPFTVTVPGDPANTGASLERPNLIGPPSSDCGSGHLVGCISAAAFAPIPVGTYAYGNAARNLLPGPGLVNFDFSLLKNFPVTEKAKLQLRGDAFNSFNTPAFSNPSAVFGQATFGTISSAGSPRLLQVAAKLIF